MAGNEAFKYFDSAQRRHLLGLSSNGLSPNAASGRRGLSCLTAAGPYRNYTCFRESDSIVSYTIFFCNKKPTD